MIKFSGPSYAAIDNRLMSLQLVSQGLTNAVMFRADGETVQPAEVFYKKAILVERGSFRPVTYATNDMLDGARRVFLTQCDCSEDEVLVLMEMTLEHLLAGGQLDHADFLARVDILRALGRTVLISKFGEYYRLAAYLFRYTNRAIGLVMGVPTLREIFDEKYYADLEGGILESFGRLFKNDLRLFVYPMLRDDQVVTVDTVAVADELQPLYDYLARRGSFVGLDNYKPDYLPILSREVLKRIPTEDTTWEPMVPPEVCDLVKKRGFFGYQRDRSR